MDVNPIKLIQLKNSWTQFKQNHPKFSSFCKAVYKTSLQEGTVIEFKVTTPDGREVRSNIKLQPSDLDFFQEIMNLKS